MAGSQKPASPRDDDLRVRLRAAVGAAQSAHQGYLAHPSRATLQELILAWQLVLQPPFRGLLEAEHRAIAAGNLGAAYGWSYQLDGRAEDLGRAIRYNEEALASVDGGSGAAGSGAAARENWLGWIGALAQCLRQKAALDQDRTCADRAVELLATALAVLTPQEDDWATCATHLALALQGRYDLEGELRDLRRAAGLRRAVVRHPGADNVDTAGGELAACLLELDQAGDEECLDEAIEVLGEVAIGGSPNAVSAEINFTLGVALARRFERSGSPRDARNAVAAYSRAVSLDRDDRKAKFRSGLGAALHDLWRVTGEYSMLEQAIEEFGHALRQCSTSVDETQALYGLAHVRMSQFRRTGEVADLRDALRRLRHALASAPDDPRLSITLAGALLDMYEFRGAATNLTEALRLLERAVGRCVAGSPDFRAAQTTLGNALRRRFDRGGDAADLDRAIQCHRAATDGLDNAAPDASAHLINYGNALRMQYTRSGDPRDLNAARQAYALADQAAVSETCDGVLAGQAVVRLNTYQRTGEIEELEAAIDALSDATELCAPTSPALPTYLSDLGAAYKLRYLHTGQLPDLERAIVVLGDAVARTYPKAPDHAAYLANRGTLWLDLCHRTGMQDAVDCGVTDLAAAVEATPESGPQRVTYEAMLGSALLVRAQLAEVSEIEADPRDLDNAVALLQSVIALTAGEGPVRPQYLGELGRVLLVRYQRDGHESDLDEAVGLLEQAEQSAEEGMPHRADLLASLAYALRYRWQLRHAADDLHRGVQYYEAACQAGIAGGIAQAAETARDWATWALNRESWDEAARAYRLCIEGICHLVSRHQARHHKEAWLFVMAQVPSRAAYACARAGDASAAAAVFERARALLLQEATDWRRALLADHPDLHARYRASLAAMDATAAAGARAQESGQVSGQLAQQLHQAGRDLDQILEEIAAVTGRAPGHVDLQNLQPELVEGAWVVQLAPGPSSTIALIHPPGDAAIVPLALKEVTETTLREHFDSFLSAYDRRRTALPDWLDTLDKLTSWLGGALLRPLLSAVPADADVILIAGGILGLLPLHAAWVRDRSDAHKRLYFLDRVRVRHAPTAASLREAADAASRARTDSALLIDDPRPQSLPVGASRVGRETLATLFDQCVTLAGDAATPLAVLDAMGGAEHGVIHLSCHAQADREWPLDTAFLLAGQSRLSARDLSGASALPIRLAVLAGCETGVVGSNLPDEVVGLPTALVAAGVAGVISSAWAIRDHPVTAMLLARFYQLWRTEGHEPAEALRRAQRWIRDTTNAEKARHFQGYGASFKGKAGGPAHRLWASTAGHSHPYWWAGFSYTGV